MDMSIRIKGSFFYFKLNADMLSGTKIAGQLRKNSSGHATQIFAKKSRKFEIPVVRVKRFCKAVLMCRLRALKTSISLGT